MTLNFFLLLVIWRFLLQIVLLDQNRQKMLEYFLLQISSIPAFVQLAFVDCIGGCNGCIDLQNPANLGNYKSEILEFIQNQNMTHLSLTKVYLSIPIKTDCLPPIFWNKIISVAFLIYIGPGHQYVLKSTSGVLINITIANTI